MAQIPKGSKGKGSIQINKEKGLCNMCFSTTVLTIYIYIHDYIYICIMCD